MQEMKLIEFISEIMRRGNKTKFCFYIELNGAWVVIKQKSQYGVKSHWLF